MQGLRRNLASSVGSANAAASPASPCLSLSLSPHPRRSPGRGEHSSAEPRVQNAPGRGRSCAAYDPPWHSVLGGADRTKGTLIARLWPIRRSQDAVCSAHMTRARRRTVPHVALRWDQVTAAARQFVGLSNASWPHCGSRCSGVLHNDGSTSPAWPSVHAQALA